MFCTTNTVPSFTSVILYCTKSYSCCSNTNIKYKVFTHILKFFKIYFKRMFITLSGKAEVNFWTVGRKTLPFTLGYQHESVVEGVLTNTGEPIFNANFTIEYPRLVSLLTPQSNNPYVSCVNN